MIRKYDTWSEIKKWVEEMRTARRVVEEYGEFQDENAEEFQVRWL